MGNAHRQAVAAAALAGSDADRRAAAPGLDGWTQGTLADAQSADTNDFTAWVAAQRDLFNQHKALLDGLPAPTSQFVDPAVGTLNWLTVPDFSESTWNYKFYQQPTDVTDQTARPDQAAMDKAVAITKASTDQYAQYYGYNSNDPMGRGVNAYDVADYITRDGLANAAPAPGSVEFRTDVENLKVRWFSCTADNPLDPHVVLGPEVRAAVAEFGAELDAQAAQRNDIVAAQVAASADLSKASDAMNEAMGAGLGGPAPGRRATVAGFLGPDGPNG